MALVKGYPRRKGLSVKIPKRVKRSLSITLSAAILSSALTIVVSVLGLQAAFACQSQTRYWYAETYSYYSGGTDGMAAGFNGDSTPPYVCDDTTSHTVESVALYLPFPNDLIENGVDRGVAGSQHGSCICPGYYYFFQFTQAGGTNYLQVEGQGESAHTFYVQEIVTGCPSNCHLAAQYTTDLTVWPLVSLPAGDNPGTQVVINGEVYGDNTDDMGPGDESADWTNPQYHAGAWHPWFNKNATIADLPYCNNDLSVGTSYHFQNWGPLPKGWSC